jgi:hypothetical protein
MNHDPAIISQLILDELHSQLAKPRNLLPRINLSLDESGNGSIDLSGLLEVLLDSHNQGDSEQNLIRKAQVLFQVRANRFVNDSESAGWSNEPAGSLARYMDVFSAFGFPEEFHEILHQRFPFEALTSGMIIGERRTWYRDAVISRSTYYSDKYLSLLSSRSYVSDESIARLDRATTNVVSMLEDPCFPSRPTRGLVVGHVQSGKTANFAGVITKAIDIGYRLVIVLTGSTDMLRRQTQRRLDREIVGFENIMMGKTPEENPEFFANLDYVKYKISGFPEEFQHFDEHLIQSKDVPRIQRLTDAKDDFATIQRANALALNQSAFSFGTERPSVDKPIFHWENLKSNTVRFIVVKKESTNLKRVFAEIYENRTAEERRLLEQIPTLIIDDEADYAGLNNLAPDKVTAVRERTEINNNISALLIQLKRAQYVGYTATPFANLLTNKLDERSLFPRDFILPLPTPDGYMGAAGFHDISGLPDGEEGNPFVSNEAAFIREFQIGVSDEDALLKAIDLFVLTGAIKLWRSGLPDFSIEVTHHTMLVHLSGSTRESTNFAGRINDVV